MTYNSKARSRVRSWHDCCSEELTDDRDVVVVLAGCHCSMDGLEELHSCASRRSSAKKDEEHDVASSLCVCVCVCVSPRDGCALDVLFTGLCRP